LIRSPVPVGNDETEGAAFPLRAADRDLAAMHFNEAFTDYQPQSRASILFGQGRLQLLERLEQPIHILRGDADTVVLDADLEELGALPPD
jgi:pimeloyl-ACP methyl ester carboxylesterase